MTTPQATAPLLPFPPTHLVVSRSYELSVDTSAAEIAEAFGIEGGHVLTIADGLRIPLDYSVLYLTGESGSGKSSLLAELAEVTEVEVPASHLFEWGPTVPETLAVLSLVGLGDATLFVSTYDKLSDSQQARARLALAILAGHQLVVVDEFLSTLDRRTAQAVAYSFQKAVRRMGIRAIVATAHDDLAPYLMPDVVVRGRAFPSRFVVEEPVWPEANPITSSVQLRYTDKEFYRALRLGELHYKGKYTGGTKEYLAAFLGDDCIGILVSVYRKHDGGRRIARVVVHPSYRGTGVGVALVRRYVADYPGADVVAVMASYNPVFERAGMTRVEDSVVAAPAGLRKAVTSLGFDVTRWHERSYCTEFMQDEKNRQVLATFAGSATHLVCPGGRYLTRDEVAERIVSSSTTAGRVLWGLRERRLAKFTTDS